MADCFDGCFSNDSEANLRLQLLGGPTVIGSALYSAFWYESPTTVGKVLDRFRAGLVAAAERSGSMSGLATVNVLYYSVGIVAMSGYKKQS